MKGILIAGCLVALMSCGGANDGDAKTDTTSMPVDTNLMKNESNHINRRDGTIIDSAGNGKDSTRIGQ
jgi:hypothetical protein